MIGILDYGMGNLGSILNMLRKLGAQATIITTPDAIATCSKVILPGVGRFDVAMQQIDQRGYRAPLHQFAMADQKPLLGVCLGMQLLCAYSEEGDVAGLGYIPGQVRRFQPKPGFRIPHMGWNNVLAKEGAFALFKGLEKGMRFYFVHSYYVDVAPAYVMGTTAYGGTFPSVIAKGNIFGFQCHPEKSHRYGMQVYQNFIDL